MAETHSDLKSGDELRLVAMMLCERCIAGEGGECHTPGCALYMNRAPDVPVTVVCDLKVEMVDARDSLRSESGLDADGNWLRRRVGPWEPDPEKPENAYAGKSKAASDDKESTDE